MSVASNEAPAKVMFQHGEISTNMEINHRRVFLVAGKDGLARQVKGTVADPRIDPDVADFLRGIKGWTVGSWPVGYDPHEEIISAPAGTSLPPVEADPEEIDRNNMLAQMRFIGRPRPKRRLNPEAQQPETVEGEEEEERAGASEHPLRLDGDLDIEPDLGDQERISEMMAEITVLTGTVASQQARIGELERENRGLLARLDQQGRIVTPATPPKDGSDGVDRAAPTAEDLGKGPNIDPKTSKRGRQQAAKQGGTNEPPVPALPGALDGIQRA